MGETETRELGPYQLGLTDAGQLEAIRRYVPLDLLNTIPAARDTVEEERKHVTVLFADMREYTPLSEALGEAKPPTQAILRNLGFVLRTLAVAGRKARHHLEEAIRTARELGTPGYEARSLLDLGLPYRAQKRWAEARAHLQEASWVAIPLKSSTLDQKIQNALASLPG